MTRVRWKRPGRRRSPRRAVLLLVAVVAVFAAGWAFFTRVPLPGIAAFEGSLPALTGSPAQLAVLPGSSQSQSTPSTGARVDFAPVPGGVYFLDPSREAPEVVATDKRGTHMVWPATGDISTYFHESGPYWVGGYHQGLDIAAQWGWNVFAAWDGVVVEVTSGWNRGYGTTIVVDHRNGIQTRYSHLSAAMVEIGERVEWGDLIGLVGSTGAAEGPHLHFEVIVDGQQRDPLPFLPNDPDREYVG